MAARLRIAWTLAVAGAAGCASPQVSSVGPQAVSPVLPTTLSGSYVPSGTILTVRADQALDTYYTAPGSPFTATVLTPLRDRSGRLLVESGAKLHGTFVSFGSAGAPRVRVALRSIDTVDGTVPIAAAVRQAQHLDWIGPPSMTPRQAYQPPYDLLEHGREQVIQPGGDQHAVDYEIAQPTQVHVPKGALVTVQLTAPLAAGEGAHALRATFSVLEVDKANRALVLAQPEVGTRTVKAGPGVDLDKLRPGQRVELTYYPEVALAFRNAGEPAERENREGATARQGAVTEDIVAVDEIGHTVTVRGPSGRTHVIKVTDPALQVRLEGLRGGEPMQLTYTEAVAVAAEPVK